MRVNNILNNLNHLFRINHAYSFLFGMLGSLIVVSVFYYFSFKSQKIAVVNVTAIVNEFIQHETRINKQKDVLEKEVKLFGNRLQSAIKIIAKENNTVLILSEAVAGGSQDYTNLVKNRIKDGNQNDQADKDD